MILIVCLPAPAVRLGLPILSQTDTMLPVIKSFKCRETEKIFNSRFAKRFPPDIQRTAARKLAMLHAANHLNSLKIPPNNRLEKLRGKRSGQYSIRINKKWRICFTWERGDVYNAEITDYH